jgi:hypothetical protein
MRKILVLILVAVLSIGGISAKSDKTSKVITDGIETVYDDTKGTITEVYSDAKSAVTTIYGDMKDVTAEIYPDVKNAITEIAKGLGVGAEYVWTVLVKQQVVLGITELIELLLILCLIIIGVVWLWKTIKKNEAISWVVLPGAFLILFGTLMFGRVDLITIIQGLVNPDFGAINYVLNFIKTL